MIYDHDHSPGARDEENIAVRRAVCAFFLVLLLGISLALAAALLFGCGSRATSAEVYFGEQQLCLRHPTHEERQACLTRVRAEWAPDTSTDTKGNDQ